MLTTSHEDQRRRSARSHGFLTKAASGVLFLFFVGLTVVPLWLPQLRGDVEESWNERMGESVANPLERLNAFENYRKLRDAFSRNALRNGYLDYAEVVSLLYPQGAIDESVLEAKRKWRSGAASDLVFAADYDCLDVPVTVRTLAAKNEPSLGSTMVACYEANYHVVRVSEQASEAAVLHEAGHALQRDALLKRTFAQTSFVSASYEAYGDDFGSSNYTRRSEHRLRYLSSQDEFEVRLQDLNRFYAVWGHGSPVMDPLDALQALVALGMPLGWEDVSKAIRGSGFTLDQEGYEAMASETEKVGESEREIFEDASELLLLQDLILEIDPGLWPMCLRKIILESPGHL